MTQRDRIADLQAQLRQRDQRIKELTKERDDEREEVTELRESNEQYVEELERWVEIYESRKQTYSYDAKATRELYDQLDGYSNLKRDFNSLVGQLEALEDLVDERRLNGTLVKKERGRQIAATPDQRAKVFQLHDEGVSIREIAADVGIRNTNSPHAYRQNRRH
jgi:hypothetical protein